MLPEVQSFRGPFLVLIWLDMELHGSAMGAAEFCWNAALEYSLEETIW